MGADPRIAVHLDDLADDAVTYRRTLVEQDERLVGRLVALRTQIASTFAITADSTRAPGEPARPYNYEYFDSLAKLRTDLPAFALPEDRQDPTRTSKLLPILRGKLHGTEKDEQSAPLWTEYNAVEDEHAFNLREFWITEASHAGNAWLRLKHIARLLNRKLTSEELAEMGGLDFSPWEATQGAVTYGAFGIKPNPPLDDNRDYDANAAALVAALRKDVDRLGEELHRRLGTVRSHRALIARFKRQCEWYASEEFRDLASRLSKLERSKKSKENPLRDHLARYLFDQGLNPLTDPLMGGLKPDVVDFALYVEAKQYGETDRDPKKKIQQAAAQVWSTAPKIHGEPWRIHEAFLVVFRRGGRLIQLPEMVEGKAGVHLYPVLIDVIDPSRAGSRERDTPIVVSAEDLAPSENGTVSAVRRPKKSKLVRQRSRRSSSASQVPSRDHTTGSR
jgi:hypothetical protein